MPEQLILSIPLTLRRKKLGIELKYNSWSLSLLFGRPIYEGCLWAVEMVDFEMENYIYFLDNVSTWDELVRGLGELSPFADDALSVAEWMSKTEFEQFKALVPAHHKAVMEDSEPGELPEQFLPILLPQLFLPALSIAKESATSLGVTLIRLWDAYYSKK